MNIIFLPEPKCTVKKMPQGTIFPPEPKCTVKKMSPKIKIKIKEISIYFNLFE